MDNWKIGDDCYFIHDNFPYKGKIFEIHIFGTPKELDPKYFYHQINAVYSDSMKSRNYAMGIKPFKSMDEMFQFINTELEMQKEYIRG